MRKFFGLVPGPAFFVLAALFLSAAQSHAQTGGSPMILPVDPAPLVAETADGPKRFTIEIADDSGERSRGLMFRQRMPESHGMLFVFENTQPVGFWMQNTKLPLDLVFISEDGRVRAVGKGEPFSTDVISAGEPVRFVLELNAGIAQKTGIATGDRIRHPAIDAIAGTE